MQDLLKAKDTEIAKLKSKIHVRVRRHISDEKGSGRYHGP